MVWGYSEVAHLVEIVFGDVFRNGCLVIRMPMWLGDFLGFYTFNISDRPKSWVTIPRGSADVMRRISSRDRGRIRDKGKFLENYL